MLLVFLVLAVAVILTSGSLRRFLPFESVIAWVLTAIVLGGLFQLDRLA